MWSSTKSVALPCMNFSRRFIKILSQHPQDFVSARTYVVKCTAQNNHLASDVMVGNTPIRSKLEVIANSQARVF